MVYKYEVVPRICTDTGKLFTPGDSIMFRYKMVDDRVVGITGKIIDITQYSIEIINVDIDGSDKAGSMSIDLRRIESKSCGKVFLD